MAESKPKTFQGGLNTDVDPRFQPPGTYRDANNIKVVNTEGSTFTVQNFKGQTERIDLSEGGSGNIVGYYSFPDKLVLIYVDGSDTSTSTTKIYMYSLNDDGTFSSEVDSSGNNTHVYSADIEMTEDAPVKVVGVLENGGARRIYWTDNINPVRTINLSLAPYDISNYPITTTEVPSTNLELLPAANMSTPILTGVVDGSLSVGVFQYCYEYVTRDGAKSTISPMSGLFHTTNKTGTYKNHEGAPAGEESTMGFKITVENLDTNFEKVNMYAVFYETKDGPSKAFFVGENFISTSDTAIFTHTRMDNEVPINTVLEPSNTFDMAKDLAIKDNILFAANTRKSDAFISKAEFDATLKRWNSSGNSQFTRYLSSGSYVRLNQDDGGYKFLPGHKQVSYTKGYDVNDSPASVDVLTPYAYHQSGFTVGTAVEQSYSTDQEITNIEVNTGVAYRINGGTTGTAYSANTRLRFTCRLRLDTTGNGSYDKSWNGSAWASGGLETFDEDIYPTFYYANGVNVQANGLGFAEFISSINLDIATTYTTVRKISFEIDAISSVSAPTGSTITTSALTSGYYGTSSWFTPEALDGLSSDGEVVTIHKETESIDTLNEVEKLTRVLGAQSSGFFNGAGVRLTFKTVPKVSDETIGQPDNFPFIDVNDNINTSNLNKKGSYTDITANLSNTISVGSTQSSSNKDPQMLYIKGFKRGEIYRFGITFYDKKGNDINTLYMGDVQMPHSWDKNVHLKKQFVKTEPGAATEDVPIDVGEVVKIDGNTVVEDFRLDVVEGIPVPGYVDTKDYTVLDSFANPSTSNRKKNYLYPVVQESDANTRTFKHYTMDLVCMFEVRLPQSVRDKVSGYRIVRAERTEEDSSVLQQGLFRETVYSSYSGSSSQADIGDTVGANRESVHENSEKYNQKHTLGESILTDQKVESGGVNSASYIFGSFFGQINSESSGQAPNTGVNRTANVVYSPDSIFGHTPFKYKDNLKIRSVALIKLKDNVQFNQSAPYSFLNTQDGSKRYYGKKTINSTDGQDIYVGKTYTVDTQFYKVASETLPNTNKGLTYYSETTSYGNYYTYDSDDEAYTQQNSADGLYGNSTNVNKAEEMTPGSIHSDAASRVFHNASFGSINRDGIAHRSYVLDSDETGYEFNKSVQLGNRGIYVSCSNNFPLATPNLDRVLEGDRQVLFSSNYLTQKTPYMKIVEIYKSDTSTLYNGVSDDSVYSTRYIQASPFVRVESTDTDDTVYHTIANGDTFTSIFSHQLTMSHLHPDGSAGKFITFPVESRVNVEMRSGQHLASGHANAGFFPDILPNRNDILYNSVYSQTPNLKSFLSINENKRSVDFNQPVQIAYSKTKLSGELEDSFRIFPIAQFHDLDNDSGEINSIVNFRDNLYALQDKGFAKLFVNSRALVGGEEGILIGSANTIENHAYISKQYGSIHREGVLATDAALYFVDAKNKKIHRFTQNLEVLSDKGINKFLNQEVFVLNSNFASKVKSNDFPRVESSQLPFEDLANGICIGYDQNEKRLIFTFASYYDSSQYKKSVSFNEYMNAWESKLDYTPPMWIMHDGKLFSHGRINPTASQGDKGEKILEFDTDATNYGKSDATTYEQNIEVVINDDPISNKKFDQAEVVGDVDTSGTVSLTGATFSTDKTSQQSTTFATDLIHKVREGMLRFPLRGKTATKRLVGSYARVKLKNNNNTKFSIFAIVAKIRKSFK